MLTPLEATSMLATVPAVVSIMLRLNPDAQVKDSRKTATLCGLTGRTARAMMFRTADREKRRMEGKSRLAIEERNTTLVITL